MYSPSHGGGGGGGGNRGYGSPHHHHHHHHHHSGGGGGAGGNSNTSSNNNPSSASNPTPNLSNSTSSLSSSNGGKYVPRTPEGGRHGNNNNNSGPTITAIATNPLRAGSGMISNPNHTTPTKKSGLVESGVQVASTGQSQQQSAAANNSSGGGAQSNSASQQTWTGLDLSRMKLRAVSPSIAIYSFLTELYLQFNNLSVLPVDMFSALTSLRVLDLSYNAIVYLPSEISHLLHLHTLLLINNSIRELPVEMGKLFRMDKLAIEGNPLQDPPQDIIDKGAQAIVAYLRDRMPAGAPPPPRHWLINTHAEEDGAEAVSGSRLPVRRKLQLDHIDDMSSSAASSPASKPIPKSIALDPENPNVLKGPNDIRILCYNILAENYAMSERINYCPQWALQWDYRKHRILKEVTLYDPDIMCLQEVESEQFRSFLCLKCYKEDILECSVPSRERVRWRIGGVWTAASSSTNATSLRRFRNIPLSFNPSLYKSMSS
eukprot:TRINITY_DN5647_c0_g1_i1.p1 TRINITY_DN5647_c0_g1~~TRINITY_DN5647_c0_g1_i1.p1  ORF type:complete len:488 (-),score=73.58 TRINITY_DN5647_c0_g1_i1:894-2357(-)